MSMPYSDESIDSVRASRAGHTFHERWAARRALQLVFPNDDLFAIAAEGISSTETASPGTWAEDVADLVLYYGHGDSFQACERLETVQFKYKHRGEAVTASYLKKTIEKFSSTIIGYEKDFPAAEVENKSCFIFVTNAEFKGQSFGSHRSAHRRDDAFRSRSSRPGSLSEGMLCYWGPVRRKPSLLQDGFPGRREGSFESRQRAQAYTHRLVCRR